MVAVATRRSVLLSGAALIVSACRSTDSAERAPRVGDEAPVNGVRTSARRGFSSLGGGDGVVSISAAEITADLLTEHARVHRLPPGYVLVQVLDGDRLIGLKSATDRSLDDRGEPRLGPLTLTMLRADDQRVLYETNGGSQVVSVCANSARSAIAFFELRDALLDSFDFSVMHLDLVSGTVTECYRSDPNGPATPFDEIAWLDDAVYFMANQAHGGVERLDVMRWTVESGMQVVREEASNPRVANRRLYVKVRSAVDRERAELVEIDPISGAIIGARVADGVAFYAPTTGGVLWGSHLDRKLHFTDDDGHALDVGDVTLANPTGGDQCVAWQANNALNTGFSGYAWLPTRRRLVELGWLIDARADHEWLAWSALTFNSTSQLYEGKEVVRVVRLVP